MDSMSELRIKNIEKMLQEQEERLAKAEQEKKEDKPAEMPPEPTEEQLKALREKLLNTDNKTATKIFNDNPDLARKALQSK